MPYSYHPVENARLEATVEEVTAAFKAEFMALMKKYKCEMSVATSSRSYETVVDGVEFEFDGVYQDGETVRPYFSINVGTYATGDCV
jgi:hypothetical protein